MHKINYTPSERKAITEAYTAIEYATEAMRMNSLSEFAQAAAMERREYNTLHQAQAMVALAVHKGMAEPLTPVSALVGYSQGHRLLVILGAEICTHFPELFRRTFYKCQKAAEAHKAAYANHIKLYGKSHG